MRIHFGQHLDAMSPEPPVTTIGVAVVGTQGLLRLLETDLGLPPVLAHPAERLMAYRGCLAAADREDRFYHRSFRVDPINVARTLRTWREQWYEWGWQGDFPEGVGRRLADMAEVERLAVAQVPPCIGQRLGRVLDALDRRRTQIESLTLHDHPASLPVMWRKVVERLGYELAPGVMATLHAAPGTDLHRVQSRLLELSVRQEAGAQPKMRLEQDSSFIVVRAASRDISARAIAEWLKRAGDGVDTVLVAERNGIILDNALERSGLPRTGFQHYSRFRAVSQVLKLALALLWEPLNPHQLLQFLIHPVGPVPGRVRRALADAVAGQPGVGGSAWIERVQRLEQRLREEGGSDKDVDTLHATITYWFQSPRHDPATGAPVAALTERARRCAGWLIARSAVRADPAERAMYANAHAQAQALIAALEQLVDQGRETLPRVEAERLVDEVSREQPDPATFAEAGHARATTHPGNVTRAWRQTVWWDLSPESQTLTYPWSHHELAGLRAAGVALASPEERLEQRLAAWLRPILNCRERLVMVVHESDAGHHPLWTRIASVFDGWAEVNLESQLLEGKGPALPFLDVATVAVEVKALPGPRRWWELPTGTRLPERPVESYSSLSKLFYYPHGWVLNYAAQLRPGRAEDVADDNLLYGTLAHRLFEEFFKSHPSWRSLDSGRVMAWLEKAMPRLVRQEGAVLLEPGRGIDHEQVVTILERALLRLLEHLAAADVVGVEAERAERAPFLRKGLEIGGAIDLVLTTAAGREVVLDAKWGSESYRASELEANAHLQLASYAYLRRHATGGREWPYQAYFIITTGNIVAPDDRVFPEALVREPAGGVDVAGLWARAEATYAWRRTQLDSGHIEVCGDAAAPTERSTPPETGLPMRDGDDRFDDFARLTGWDEFA